MVMMMMMMMMNFIIPLRFRNFSMSFPFQPLVHFFLWPPGRKHRNDTTGWWKSCRKLFTHIK